MRLILDIEADGHLEDATKIHCVVCKEYDKDQWFYFYENDADKFREFIEEQYNSADLQIIGHNIFGYDYPAIELLWNVELLTNSLRDPNIWRTGDPLLYLRDIDTLSFSRSLHPDREGGHSLERWGKYLGFPKIEFNDFSKFSDEMLEYCKQDVLLTERVFKELMNEYESTRLD